MQIGAGLCLGLLIRDAFWLSRSVPLIQPRLPGRQNFALFLTLYIGILSPALFAVIWSELRMESHLRLLLWLVLATLASHAVFLQFQQTPMEQEEMMEGYNDEFQLLHLS